MAFKSAVVVCPGRGVYTASELGYIAKHHGDKRTLIESFDHQRTTLGQETIAALDGAAQYSASKYTRGDNAAGLIYACSYADFLDIDTGAFDIVAVTGNSMGWYTALACAGALNGEDGFRVANTMGTIMQKTLIGGQMVYPVVDEHWREIEGAQDAVLELVDEVPGLYVSIHLGGMLVLAGEAAALEVAEKRLAPVEEPYPMRLRNHAAFHTELQASNSEKGKAALPAVLFQQPSTPLIDGRGHIWLPKATDLNDLWSYTFAHQVTEPYDFTQAVKVALHEFAPDAVILLGPGATLGGATAQTMIADGWNDWRSKSDFISAQKDNPYLLSMGLQNQRRLVMA